MLLLLVLFIPFWTSSCWAPCSWYANIPMASVPSRCIELRK